MNILVTGSTGQLALCLKDYTINDEYHGHYFFFKSHNELDITNKNEVISFITINNIKLVINCAAYTAVDAAESDAKHAYEVNVNAVKYLADAVHDMGGNMIHISTDYVFNGYTSVPYDEMDDIHPKCVYGLTKSLGERQLGINDICIRTSWLYSEYGKNFVKTMINLMNQNDYISVVYDQIGTPTYAGDLASIILMFVEDYHPGIYNFSNEGVCSWYDFAKAIMDIKGYLCTLQPIRTLKYPTPAARPPYSVLDKTKIKNTLKLDSIPYWKDSLIICLNKIKYEYK